MSRANTPGPSSWVAVCSRCGHEHPGSLTCFNCNTFISGSYFVPWDVPATIGQSHACVQCSLCDQLIQGEYIFALEKYWHSECFKCEACHKPIEDQYFCTDEKNHLHHSYCIISEEARCQGCKQTIHRGDFMAFAVGYKWHPRCLKCTYCNGLLSTLLSHIAHDNEGGALHMECLTKYIESRYRGDSPVDKGRSKSTFAGVSSPVALAEGEEHYLKAHSWSPEEVCDWLDTEGFSRYQFRFRSKNVDGKMVLQMGLGDLRSWLGIEGLEDRRAIIESIDRLRSRIHSISTKMTDQRASSLLLDRSVARPADAPEDIACPPPFFIINSKEVHYHKLLHGKLDQSSEGVSDISLPAKFIPSETGLGFYRTASHPEPSHIKQGEEYARRVAAYTPGLELFREPDFYKSRIDVNVGIIKSLHDSFTKAEKSEVSLPPEFGAGKLISSTVSIGDVVESALTRTYAQPPLQPLPFKRRVAGSALVPFESSVSQTSSFLSTDEVSSKRSPKSRGKSTHSQVSETDSSFLLPNEYFSTAQTFGGAPSGKHFDWRLRAIEHERDEENKARMLMMEERQSRRKLKFSSDGPKRIKYEPTASPEDSVTKVDRVTVEEARRRANIGQKFVTHPLESPRTQKSKLLSKFYNHNLDFNIDYKSLAERNRKMMEVVNTSKVYLDSLRDPHRLSVRPHTSLY